MPTGDFISSFSGPQNGDLDLTRIEATYNGATFRLDAITAAPIGATNVLFASIIIVNPAAGNVTVRDLVTGAANVLPTTTVTVNGNHLGVSVPANLLSSPGLEQAKF